MHQRRNLPELSQCRRLLRPPDCRRNSRELRPTEATKSIQESTAISIHIKANSSGLLLLRLFLLQAATARGQEALATFSFEDHLNRFWRNELVFYPMDEEVWGRTDMALIGRDGEGVPLQWVAADQSPSGKASVAFLASVPGFGEPTFTLQNSDTAVKDGELRIMPTRWI